MVESRVFPERRSGIISRIRLENFMCHSRVQIELGDWVNFITGQNGSGKMAILTALCVVFGCRAKGTQRANSPKDFIKTGCSYAAIFIEIKNEGEDAYMPETYGNIIILERRITDSSNSVVLKDHLGRKVAQRSKELGDLVEYFNMSGRLALLVQSVDATSTPVEKKDSLSRPIASQHRTDPHVRKKMTLFSSLLDDPHRSKKRKSDEAAVGQKQDMPPPVIKHASEARVQKSASAPTARTTGPVLEALPPPFLPAVSDPSTPPCVVVDSSEGQIQGEELQRLTILERYLKVMDKKWSEAVVDIDVLKGASKDAVKQYASLNKKVVVFSDSHTTAVVDYSARFSALEDRLTTMEAQIASFVAVAAIPVPPDPVATVAEPSVVIAETPVAVAKPPAAVPKCALSFKPVVADALPVPTVAADSPTSSSIMPAVFFLGEAAGRIFIEGYEQALFALAREGMLSTSCQQPSGSDLPASVQ